MKNYFLIATLLVAAMFTSCEDNDDPIVEVKSIEISNNALDRGSDLGTVVATISSVENIEKIEFVQTGTSSNSYFELSGNDLLLKEELNLVEEDKISVSIKVVFDDAEILMQNLVFNLSGEIGVYLRAGISDVSLIANNEKRYFSYYVPENCPEDAPVWYIFHGSLGDGAGITAEEAYSTTNWMLDAYDTKKIADAEKVILVAPFGFPLSESYGWNVEDNLPFFDELMNYFHSLKNLNTKTFYASGKSSGAIFSLGLSVERADDLAAIAPVCGNYAIQKKIEKGTIKFPENPTNLRVYLGTEDDRVIYDDSDYGVLANMALYAENAYMCDMTTEDNSKTYIEPSTINDRDIEGFTLRVKSYTNCEKNATLEVAAMNGIAHWWPASLTPNVWEFLSKYSK